MLQNLIAKINTFLKIKKIKQKQFYTITEKQLNEIKKTKSTFNYFIDNIKPNTNLDRDWVYRALGYETAEVASFTIEKGELFKVEVHFYIQGTTKAVTESEKLKIQNIVNSINKSELKINDAPKATQLVESGDIELVDSCWIESFVNVELFGNKLLDNYPTGEVYGSVHECGSIDAIEMVKWIIKIIKEIKISNKKILF